MKLIKTEDGQIALLLTPEFIQQILDAQPKKERKFIRPKGDVFYCMKAKSVELFKAIKEKFGDAIIDRKDAVLSELIHESRVSTFSTVLGEMEKRGGAIVVRNETGRIDSFQLIF